MATTSTIRMNRLRFCFGAHRTGGGLKLWVTCAACRSGEEFTGEWTLRCLHRHRQVRTPEGAYVDAGMAEEVSLLNRNGIRTFSSCEDDGWGQRYVGLWRSDDADRALALLPSYEPSDVGYAGTIILRSAVA